MSEDQIFEELKTKLLDEIRLLKRFYEFSTAYQDFEFDELGLNTDEAENEKRKALKIKDKLFEKLIKNFKYPIKEINTDILNNKIELNIEYNINESKKIVEFILSVKEDSFTLEIKTS